MQNAFLVSCFSLRLFIRYYEPYFFRRCNPNINDIFLSSQVGFVLATTGVEVPKHPSLNFQHEPVKSMTYKSIPNGLTLEAHANVKENCKRNDNRSFICQLVQFSAGLKASTNIRIHSNLKGMLIELKFHSDGRIPKFSPEILSKV